MTAAHDVLVFEPDLLFSSKIDGSIRKMGARVRVITDDALLLQDLRKDTPKLLILNLDALEGKLGTLWDVLSGKPCVSVGYYSHTNTRLGEEANHAGIGVVMSRAAFVNRIQEILARVLRGK
jgi:hypothetical protein